MDHLVDYSYTCNSLYLHVCVHVHVLHLFDCLQLINS